MNQETQTPPAPTPDMPIENSSAVPTSLTDAGHEFYWKVAESFASRVKTIFASESSLTAAWTAHFPAIPFDRTDKWNLILQRELSSVWGVDGPPVKSSMTAFDRTQVLHFLADLLDYNLFSQVLLNLQSWALLRYRADTADADTKALEAKWAGKSPSPLDAKAKMFKAASDTEQIDFNQDLSTLKSLKIIAGLSPAVSFRVSAIGTTPALVDSCNLSMLGVGGDPYLVVPPDWRAYYFTWDAAPEVVQLNEAEGTWLASGIDYPFTSKSGGDILNTVLAVRHLTVSLYQALEAAQRVVLPRMNSILLLTTAPDAAIRQIHTDLQREYAWPMTLSERSRFV